MAIARHACCIWGIGLLLMAASWTAAGQPSLKPAASAEGEVLYNGIQLPAIWPPLEGWRTLDQEPMPVPCLEHPPAVIPIDIGRQLFVDDFLVESTTLQRRYHTAVLHPASPVLKADKPWEDGVAYGPLAMPFSDGVWYDPADKKFKMWYMGGFVRHTCLALSRDGIRWEKPCFDVVKDTNVVHQGTRDSCTVCLDLVEKDPQKRLKMFRVTNKNDEHPKKWPPDDNYVYLAVHASPDGIHWSEPLKPLRRIWGDRTTAFYNPFRQVWCYSLRNGMWGKTPCRSRYYFEHKDFMHAHFGGPLPGGLMRGITPWVTADELDLADPDYPKSKPQLYTLDAGPYESLMLGLLSIMRNRNPKINDLCIGFSRDGFHWHRPLRQAFIPVPKEKGWLNKQSAGGLCLVVGDQLYFYFAMGGAALATLRRDGFASMEAENTPGVLTTRPVRFQGKYLFVNLDAPQGQLQVELLDKAGSPIPPFTRANCRAVSVDSTRQRVQWTGAEDLSAVAGQPIRFRFHLRGGGLFSFWVSPSPSGASHGYVAAGGPGFTGPRDTVGAEP